MNLGFDLDNTLFRLPTVEMAAKELGLPFSQKDSNDWALNCFPKEMKLRIKKLFRTPEHMGNLLPYPGNPKKLKQWKEERHKLFAVTARTSTVHEVTFDMCDRHFPGIFESVEFVEHDVSKQPLLEKNKIDKWFDDAPMEVQRTAYNGIDTIMISNRDTAYNFYFRGWHMINWIESVADYDL